ncbi:expressed unknown protein [Seminavis robusta]|uniref:Uncharacterized protein n=1 Tax=Seminavis robusta TaxID=568900 RepID=A0A9N8EXX1_9STRA|nr:expressed unknown protein [Seminavis robusta]|eukprot:Sro2769_g336700.1 n/a (164) ;mRNA; r:1490-2061
MNLNTSSNDGPNDEEHDSAEPRIPIWQGQDGAATGTTFTNPTSTHPTSGGEVFGRTPLTTEDKAHGEEKAHGEAILKLTGSAALLDMDGNRNAASEWTEDDDTTANNAIDGVETVDSAMAALTATAARLRDTQSSGQLSFFHPKKTKASTSEKGCRDGVQKQY